MVQYQVLEEIGKGTYSKVYKAKNIETNKIVAFKTIQRTGAPTSSLREISILKELQKIPQHDNIIRCDLECTLGDVGKTNLNKSLFQDYSSLGLSKVVTLWYRAPEILLGSSHYSMPIDVWSAACIFGEMLNQSPLFPGSSQIDLLFRIFRTMGDYTWPEVTLLRDYDNGILKFPNFPPMDLETVFPSLEPAGRDLLSRMLCLDPAQRISAQAALEHPYFN